MDFTVEMFCVTGQITHTLRADGFDASEDTPIPILEVGARTGVSTSDKRAGLGVGIAGDPMFTLQAGKQHGVGVGAGVRRLTPMECERLQGFPDGYTLVPVRGAPACDGPRYKALGNSMAVACMRWLGLRIQATRAAMGAARGA
jgi:DNA (cytosine-5)-methyltransferase 1